MKPISIRFSCFGPYMDEQFIDFTKLEENGLFLICGETGAGKTTILDAICYALFNQSSGSTRGKGLAVMRCKQAQKTDLTLVEYVFSVDGRRYKFQRTLEFKRKNIRDEHQCWEERDGEFVPLFENPKESSVTAKAQALIGLTYDQFRQVIILPQGQFEKLLISDSDEKERILVTLFHTSRWQQMSEELYRRVKEQDTALRAKRQACQTKLAEYGCQTTQELSEKTEDLGLTLETQEQQVAQANKEATALQENKEQALLLDEAFHRLQAQKDMLQKLRGQEPAFAQLDRKLQAAAKAQSIQPQYILFRQQQQAKDTAAAQLLSCANDSDAAHAALNKTIQRQQRHEAGSIDQADRRKHRTLLESKVPLYTTLDEQRQRAESSDAAYKKQKRIEDIQSQKYKEAHALWIDSQLRQRDAIAAYQQAQTLYLREIGGILAQELRDGLPCPVCGSTTHPAPAVCGSAHISEAKLEALNQAVTAAAEAVSRAAEHREKAGTAQKNAAQQAQTALQEALTAKQTYALSLEQRVPKIETLSQLNSVIARLSNTIDAYEKEGLDVQHAKEEADRAAAAARSLLEVAEAAASEARIRAEAVAEQWETVCQDAGFPTHQAYEAALMDPLEQQREQERLSRYKQELLHTAEDLQEQEYALAGKTQPDLNFIDQKLKAARAAAQSLQRQLDLNTARLTQMRNDLTTLETELLTLDAARVQLDGDLEFADRLRGSRGLSLQRYVLGVMLSSITAEANRLLKNVYGGRYQLFRSQELGDRRQKSGLDLEVLDHANGQRRSVKTLSGGEKFLVALGLAIGLSTVVQAQGGGVRLGAMFIDEGFGSLDRDAICDALDILDGIRKGSGLVGIISHVDQLAESIPAKIEVKKGRNGSTCVIKA